VGWVSGGAGGTLSDLPHEEKAGEKERGQDEELRKSLEEAERKEEQLATSLKYLQADFENYRKRMDKEMKDVEDSATLKVVLRLLSVLDALDLAIANGEASQDNDTLLDGIRMVYKSLYSSLEKEGLQQIDAVGKPFNPELHEAIEKEGGDTEGEAVVSEEVRKGYFFRGKVIRPSMVKVKLVSLGADKSEVNVNE
jgi:molecular chaperone GrpE